ncbi:carboxypeptidase-like regulatory domain-containing protein [Dactylosporangium sp. AC04546]|uniref:carboxypeptidase-like regulatory domain-containing protein n=1 Tax=Dactylosporangium sp. AC04546 TaxID=2862460 RepID=UPI001EE06E43|nr:carboxypeptidase-like regulatory domain-containing protein [Dactylosporangium sp. AC04546]WVK82918.1 carboxypeptidase-like regulatory domain-containing protein [Dactylosporangium sp. AC04546]
MRNHALRRVLAGAAAAIIALLPVGPAHAGTAGADGTTGTISGRLQNRDGSPTWAYLTVFTTVGQNYAGSAYVPAAGTFSVDVPAGSYKLVFNVRGRFEQWSGGATSFAAAVPVEVVAGQVTEVTETVLPTGSIAGRVTRADGSSAAGVPVYAGGSATTDGSGAYRIDDLLVGEYTVSFLGPHGVSQYAHGTLDPAAAERFAVLDGQVTTVDETLLPTGSVRIVAHDATTGEPLAGFCAWAPNVGGCAAGTELVVDDIFAAQYQFTVYLDDRLHLPGRGTVTVTGGQTAALDVAVRRGATITATMVERAGGTATDGCVTVATVNGLYGLDTRGFCSDATPGPTPGSVVIGPLEPGTYQLLADPRDPALGLQWVGAAGGTGDRAKARRITVASGDRITAPAIRFDAGTTIHGRVTDAATGAPLTACVSVVALAHDYVPTDSCPAHSEPDGTYSIPGVGPYAWPVEFVRYGYQWRWSGDAVNRRTATPVTAVADAQLRTGGGTLTGTVTDASGHPVRASVVAVDALTGEAVAVGAGPDPAGYTITKIPPQRIKVYYSTTDGRTGWVGGADLAHARPFQVRDQRTVTVNIVIG